MRCHRSSANLAGIGIRFTLFDTLGVRFRKPMVREAIDAYAALAKRRGISLAQLAEDIAAAPIQERFPNPAG